MSRYYAELVPSSIPTADEFWGRYFFRRSLLEKPAVIDFEAVEEEEEQVEWGKEDDSGEEAVSSDLVAENDRLRGIIRSLTVKISELEKDLSKKNALLEEFARKEQKIQMVASADRWKRAPVAVGTSESASSPELDNTEISNDDSQLKGNDAASYSQSNAAAVADTQSSESLPASDLQVNGEEDRSRRAVESGSPLPAATAVHSAMRMLDEEAEEEDDGWS